MLSSDISAGIYKKYVEIRQRHDKVAERIMKLWILRTDLMRTRDETV